MGRIRTIKPEFFQSETVASLSFRTRLTWIGLWTQCDNYGRAKDNARLIRGAIWSLDDVSIGDVEDDLTELARVKLIYRYIVDGRRYLVVTHWDEHQYRANNGPARYPAPDDGAELAADLGIVTSGQIMLDDEETFVAPSTTKVVRRTTQVFPNQGTGNREQGTGVLVRATPREPRKKGSRLPAEWKPTPSDVAWSRQKRYDDGWAKRQTEMFCNYWHAESGSKATKLNWSKAWKVWLDRAAERNNPAKRQTTDDIIDGFLNRIESPGELE